MILADNPCNEIADIRLLKDNHFLVYTLYNTGNVDDTIKELQPNIILINGLSKHHLTEAYTAILSNESCLDIPVVYTLDEDDVYLVSTNRLFNTKKMVTDNLVQAIKIAVCNNKKQIVPSHAGRVKLLSCYMQSLGLSA